MMCQRWVAAALSAAAVFTFAASAAQANDVWFSGAVNGRHMRPSTLWLSADGTLVVLRLHWSKWGGRVAVGKGTAEYHGCMPDCALAPVHHAAVTVNLWNVRSCASGDYYNKVTLYKRRGKLPVGFQHWAPC